MVELPTDVNYTDGLGEMFLYLGNQYPLTWSLFLSAFCFIVIVGGYFYGASRNNDGDLPFWCLFGFFASTILAIFMTSLSLISGYTVVIFLVGAILSSWWYFSSR